MRSRRTVYVEPAKAAPPTAVVRLLSEMSTDDLEAVAVDVVREHRRRLQCAQQLFEAIERDRKTESLAPAANPARLRHDYRMALVNLHGQHQLVSLVVGVLGYVPRLDDDSSSARS